MIMHAYLCVIEGEKAMEYLWSGSGSRYQAVDILSHSYTLEYMCDRMAGLLSC